ncbi:hypothetical protein [Bradyrhizobium sp. Ai1a-2]|uniref:hypothetical protein n=1 Tax=Bradyrhizobium sp. Ai1a-2 TaxID=196490 RepID=UPI0004871D90|nr:hypothetical protein [Bradyrhizobium sp. Ai1a-2]
MSKNHVLSVIGSTATITKTIQRGDFSVEQLQRAIGGGCAHHPVVPVREGGHARAQRLVGPVVFTARTEEKAAGFILIGTS